MSPFRNGLNQGFFTPQSFMRDIRQTVCRPGTCSSVFADGSTIAGFLWQAVSLSSVITTARLHLNICVLFFFHVLDIFHPPVLHGIEHRSEFLTYFCQRIFDMRRDILILCPLYKSILYKRFKLHGQGGVSNFGHPPLQFIKPYRSIGQIKQDRAEPIFRISDSAQTHKDICRNVHPAWLSVMCQT